MKRIALIVCASILGLCILAANEAPKKLHFPTHGYSIAPLEAPSDAASTTLMMMFLPAADGFAPNVNVIVQHSNASLAEYINQMKQECDKLNWTIVKTDKINDNTVIFEYTGVMQGRELHWYAKAVKQRTRVFVATATSTEKGWHDNSPKLQSSVDSFEGDAEK
jgi:hypothetical protein